jgi:hypothetical protein
MKLIKYSFGMLAFPLATFYFSFYFIFKGDPEMLGWSGVLAIVATNIVIVAYVLMAWNEDAEDAKQKIVVPKKED